MTDDDQCAAVECMARAVVHIGAADPDQAVAIVDHALRALREAGWSVSRWQPIETAPKEIHLLIGHRVFRGVTVGWLTDNGEWASDVQNAKPTDWFPFPPLPDAQK